MCIQELQDGYDSIFEIIFFELVSVSLLSFIIEMEILCQVNVFIVIVFIFIDKYCRLDFKLFELVSCLLGEVIKKGDLVIYEFIVYLGCIEEVCVFIIEFLFGLIYNVDFYVGYSFECINLGDKFYWVNNIVKVIFGFIFEIVDFVDVLYQKIVIVGIYKVSSIQVVEVVKVIENM